MKFQVSSFKFHVQRCFAVLALFALGSSLFAASGDWQIGVKNDSGQLVAKNITLSNGQVLGKTAGLPAAITPFSGVFADLSSKPTTLAGYGITDSITAALAASTYEPIIGLGTLALNKLATDPLARANHTGTQAWSTLTGTPTTLAGYGITDSITAALAAATYEPIITAGTTGQYFRGDKSWQTLNAAAVGLGNVENTALSTWTGSTNLATLGTITAGTWQGSIIAPAYLGTGSSITTKFLRGDGTWQTVESGLTIDSTAISGGTIGNVLFHKTGNIVGELGTSTGGNGVADAGKIPLFGNNGDLTASSGFTVYDGGASAQLSTGGFFFSDGTNSIVFSIPGVLASGNFALTLPTGVNGTLITTGDTGSVTNAMLAGSIALTKLSSSTSTALGVGSIELGHATDTTIARVSAGKAAIEGDTIATLAAANVFTAAQTITPATTATTGLTVNGKVVIAADGSGTDLRFGSAGMYMGNVGNNRISITDASTGSAYTLWNDSSLYLSKNTGSIGWRNGATTVFSDASNQLDFRNSTSACAVRVYNTYTSSTNHEAAGMWWSSNVAFIGSLKGSGGGTARDVALVYDSSEKARINSSGLKIGSNGTAIGQLKRTAATLVAGTATISDTDTTANTHVSIMVATPAGTTGTLSVTVTAGTGYVINSSSALDTSTLVIKATHFP